MVSCTGSPAPFWAPGAWLVPLQHGSCSLPLGRVPVGPYSSLVHYRVGQLHGTIKNEWFMNIQ